VEGEGEDRGGTEEGRRREQGTKRDSEAEKKEGKGRWEEEGTGN
jgi:hypothetical protein